MGEVGWVDGGGGLTSLGRLLPCGRISGCNWLPYLPFPLLPPRVELWARPEVRRKRVGFRGGSAHLGLVILGHLLDELGASWAASCRTYHTSPNVPLHPASWPSDIAMMGNKPGWAGETREQRLLTPGGVAGWPPITDR